MRCTDTGGSATTAMPITHHTHTCRHTPSYSATLAIPSCSKQDGEDNLMLIGILTMASKGTCVGRTGGQRRGEGSEMPKDSGDGFLFSCLSIY